MFVNAFVFWIIYKIAEELLEEVPVFVTKRVRKIFNYVKRPFIRVAKFFGFDTVSRFIKYVSNSLLKKGVNISNYRDVLYNVVKEFLETDKIPSCEDFVHACKKRGIPANVAKMLWTCIQEFVEEFLVSIYAKDDDRFRRIILKFIFKKKNKLNKFMNKFDEFCANIYNVMCEFECFLKKEFRDFLEEFRKLHRRNTIRKLVQLVEELDSFIDSMVRIGVDSGEIILERDLFPGKSPRFFRSYGPIWIDFECNFVAVDLIDGHVSSFLKILCDGGIVLLVGVRGSGKTVISRYLAYSALKNNIQVLFISPVGLKHYLSEVLSVISSIKDDAILIIEDAHLCPEIVADFVYKVKRILKKNIGLFITARSGDGAFFLENYLQSRGLLSQVIKLSMPFVRNIAHSIIKLYLKKMQKTQLIREFINFYDNILCTNGKAGDLWVLAKALELRTQDIEKIGVEFIKQLEEMFNEYYKQKWEHAMAVMLSLSFLQARLHEEYVTEAKLENTLRLAGASSIAIEIVSDLIYDGFLERPFYPYVRIPHETLAKFILNGASKVDRWRIFVDNLLHKSAQLLKEKKIQYIILEISGFSRSLERDVYREIKLPFIDNMIIFLGRNPKPIRGFDDEGSRMIIAYRCPGVTKSILNGIQITGVYKIVSHVNDVNTIIIEKQNELRKNAYLICFDNEFIYIYTDIFCSTLRRNHARLRISGTKILVESIRGRIRYKGTEVKSIELKSGDAFELIAKFASPIKIKIMLVKD